MLWFTLKTSNTKRNLLATCALLICPQFEFSVELFLIKKVYLFIHLLSIFYSSLDWFSVYLISETFLL